MQFIERFGRWWRREFGDGCIDPVCGGTMQLYDNNVGNDLCDTCHRTWRMIEREQKRQATK